MDAFLQHFKNNQIFYVVMWDASNLTFIVNLQEAQSKFEVEIDPTDAINIEPLNGIINLEGSASLHFTRTSSSPVTGRINCKVSLYLPPMNFFFDPYLYHEPFSLVFGVL